MSLCLSFDLGRVAGVSLLLAIPFSDEEETEDDVVDELSIPFILKSEGGSSVPPVRDDTGIFLRLFDPDDGGVEGV